MKRLFSVLALACAFLLCSCACAESLKTYSTGHFTFKAPSTWLSSKIGDIIYLYGNTRKNTDGGILMATESLIGSVENLDEAYNQFAESFVNNSGSDVQFPETVYVNNHKSFLFAYDHPINGISIKTYSLICMKGDYVLTLLFMDTLMNDMELRNKILECSETIAFASSELLDDSEKVERAARLVYGDRLVSCKSGEYITINIKEKGSADDIRNATNVRAVSFLREIRKERETTGLEFKDIRFNIYADLIDIYGNTVEEQILGFNITDDVVDKINYEKMPSSNIPKIAINWFEHPVMKK